MAELPLHPGHTPRWLFDRMVKLADGIVGVLLYEYGPEEFLHRISDPFWFQSLACVLGFDWHSSGTTTVTCGVLKCALDPQEGLAVVGGKGRASRRVPQELHDLVDVFSLSTQRVEGLEHASRMAAKVDNAAVQDGHQLYHHAFFLTEKGKWTVVQQGMDPDAKTARRYHWLSDHVHSFVEEPHDCILGTKQKRALDLTARESDECRSISVDLVKEKPEKVGKALKAIRPAYQRSLEEWLPELRIEEKTYAIKTLSMPRRINWDALRRAYEFQPSNYEELLGLRGVGPATARALALISELAYGKPPSWRDPVKYSFAVGGKDGVPYPVNRRAMDESAEMLKRGVEEARLGKMERMRALQRLRSIIPCELEHGL